MQENSVSAQKRKLFNKNNYDIRLRLIKSCSISQLILSSTGYVNNVITRQRNKMNSKSLQFWFKKIETRSVKTKSLLVEYKTVTDIIF